MTPHETFSFNKLNSIMAMYIFIKYRISWFALCKIIGILELSNWKVSWKKSLEPLFMSVCVRTWVCIIYTTCKISLTPRHVCSVKMVSLFRRLLYAFLSASAKNSTGRTSKFWHFSFLYFLLFLFFPYYL